MVLRDSRFVVAAASQDEPISPRLEPLGSSINQRVQVASCLVFFSQVRLTRPLVVLPLHRAEEIAIVDQVGVTLYHLV